MKKLFIVMLFVIISVTFAADLGLYGIAPTVGIIMPEDDWEMGFQLGAKANIGVIEIAEKEIGLYPVVSYWSSKYDWETSYLDSDYEVTMSNIKFGIDAHYDLSEFVENMYAGVGVAMNRVKFEMPSVDYEIVGYDQYNIPQYEWKETTIEETDTEFGFSFLAGYNLEMSGKAIFVEGRYDLINELNTLGVKVGMYFNLK